MEYTTTSPRLRRARRVALACALTTCLAARPVDAQSPGDREASRRHFERGVALIEQRQWSEALTALSAARDLTPNVPPVLYYLGRAQRELGQRRAALASFRAFLQRAVRTPPELQREVDGYVAELQATFGRARFHVRPPTAELSVDGERVAHDAEVLLEPGPHELMTRADGHLDDARRVEARAGELIVVEVALESRPPPPRVIAAPPAPERPAQVSQEPELEPEPERVVSVAPLRRPWHYPLAILLGGRGHLGLTARGYGGRVGLRLATHHEVLFELGRSAATCIDYRAQSLGYLYVAGASSRFRPFVGATLALFVPDTDAPCMFDGERQTPVVSLAASVVGGGRVAVFPWLELFAELSVGYASGSLAPVAVGASAGLQFAVPL